MASSGDEEEIVPFSVTNYHFVDDADLLVSFSLLPLQLGEPPSESEDSKAQVFLRGTADSGLQKIFKPVIAWKLDLAAERPELHVLSRDKTWIQLLKPRKSFEDTIRTVLVAVNCLHFLKKNPDASEKALWTHLAKIFSSYDLGPSKNDLLHEQVLIKALLKEDKTLSNSKLLLTLLEEKSEKRKASDQLAHTSPDAKRSKFIVDSDDDMDEDLGVLDEDGSDEDLFDSVCAICDNGGDLLCCEGICLRSFHATEAAGSDSQCKTLGMTDAEVEAVPNFLCANCKQKKHQCFACGRLGSSDKSSNPEVFQCVSATCGHFYHPPCIAKLLFPSDCAEAEKQERKIAAGESFICPVHKCSVCKQGENKEERDLQFAICRRCPKAYHRKCLPREILFTEDVEDEENDEVVARAWEDLIPNRILIYCLKHEIELEIGTPIRNHIIFPDVPTKRNMIPPLHSVASTRRLLAKKKTIVSNETLKEKTISQKPKISEKQSYLKSEKSSHRDSSVEVKAYQESRRSIKGSSLNTTTSRVEEELMEDENVANFYVTKKQKVKPKLVKQSSSKPGKRSVLTSIQKKPSCSPPIIDDEMKQRLIALKQKLPLLTLDDVYKRQRQKLPSTHNRLRNIDKNITLGKVQGSIEALRTALQKLEEGTSIEDAKAVCEPEILYQIIKWKNKYRVYLAPFLHGMRYTSYGRHFTQPDKLEKIVKKLHWYLQNGDMMVDFGCGANDFSVLMSKKLKETGKSCFFKNYDIFQAKIDFNFEKKDWMTVERDDLFTGSQLVMGLNPPYGVRANQFIDKALEFNPKLLILIVPEETERLDEKECRYDLIWEDRYMFVGKDFYLPGSVDVNDKQMDQWNINPPHLYLWSRADWTTKHRAIALQQGHISEIKKSMVHEENNEETLVSEEINDCYNNLSKICDLPKEDNDHAGVSNEANHMCAEVYQTSCVGSDMPLRQRNGQEKDAEGRAKGDSADARGLNIAERKHHEEESRGENKPTSTVKAQEGERIGMEDNAQLSGWASSLDSMIISDDGGVSNLGAERTRTNAHPEYPYHNMPEAAPECDSSFSGSYPSADNLEEITRRYTMDREESSFRWTTNSNLGLDLRGSRSVDFGGPLDSFSQTRYVDDLNMRRREEDIRRQLRLYGRQGFDDVAMRRQFPLNQDSGLGNWDSPSLQFGLSMTPPESLSRRGPLQAFPPGLDDGSYVRAPSSFMHEPHNSRGSGSLNFAAAPRRPFPSNQGSSGWLND